MASGLRRDPSRPGLRLAVATWLAALVAAWSPAGAGAWTESFAGPAGTRPDPQSWRHDVGATGWGNGELQRYTASTANARLDGRGHLELVARRVRPGARRGSFTSARLTTRGRFAFRYGTVEMRARLPRGKGLWPAFWMLGDTFPATPWPDCGEIDVMESLGNDPFRAYGTVHGPGSLAEEGVGGKIRTRKALSAGFHRFGARWSPGAVTFTLDGRRYATVERSSYPAGQLWALDRPMYLIVNLAVGGQWPGAPSARTAFPARMAIDWIRVAGAAG